MGVPNLNVTSKSEWTEKLSSLIANASNSYHLIMPVKNDNIAIEMHSNIALSVNVMCINCVHPGYVNTDINWHTGTMPVEEGAEGSVMLALLPDGGPTGCYFDRTVVDEF
ncbi:hypothetical protein MTR67_049581 [Solanum verrucosum]|uniref:Uncharacterized protein n=1 Tax=Solanum verrucosum TaxID=315347 RepID=A0AAF0V3J0_SOLVR|nr:hypothetical protein MTR67_049581 [Solanum verrucosum]